MRLTPRRKSRVGVAAVEFAVMLPLLLLLLQGTWEVGRLVQVYQILYSATREGARIAAQGQIINLTGSYTTISVNSGTPNVYSAVKNALNAAGINTSSFATTNVAFTFVDSSGNPVASPVNPSDATKGERFTVTSTLPYSAFRWTQMSLLNITNLQVTVYWASMIDDPFTVTTTLPSWTSY